MEKDGCYYYSLGSSKREDGETEGAIACFKKSLEKEEHFKTHHRLSLLYEENSLHGKAEYHLEKAYSLNTNNDKVAVEYAAMLIAKNKINDAQKILSVILTRNKSYGPAVRLQKELSSG